MWVRDPKPDGRIQWRLYRVLAAGQALVMEYWAEPGETRAQAAHGLRKTRDVLYGRDKIKGMAAAAASMPSRSSQEAGTKTPAAARQSEPSNSQGLLF